MNRQRLSHESLEAMTTRYHLLSYLVRIYRHAAVGRNAKRMQIVECNYERAISGLLIARSFVSPNEFDASP
jgi:hypothetical protein